MVAAPETKKDTDVEMTEKPVVSDEVKKPEEGKSDDKMKPESSVDKTASEENQKKLKTAEEKLAAGKKSLLLNKPQEAVDYLAESCSLMSSVHGDMSPHMCENYFYYGRALLEVARLEEGVLGNALSGVPEGDDMDNSQVEDPDKLTEEEREDVAQKVDEALEENYKTIASSKKQESGAKSENKSSEESTDKEEAMEVEAEKSESAKKEENDVETKKESVEISSESKEETKEDSEKKEESKEESEKKEDLEKEETKEDLDKEKNMNGKKTDSEEESKEEEEEDGDEEEAEEEDTTQEEDEGQEPSQDASQGEDVSSLQLAYEVLELAKTIYLKSEDDSKDKTLKLSQVYLKLGEVGLENENYTESIEMYSQCLKLQESILPEDDRWLAETHYQLGLAHSMDNNFDEAVKHVQMAVDVIENRIKSNKAKLEKDGITVSDSMEMAGLEEAQKSVVADVQELEKILPELLEKMSDIKDTKASIAEKLKAMKSQFSGQLSGGTSGKSAFEDGSGSSGSSEVKRISTSLIRKKRKPEDEVSSEETKKARTEESSNGCGDKESAGEADQEKMETEVKA